MSDYSKIWEEIKDIRGGLKDRLPMLVSMVNSPEETRKDVDRYFKSVNKLLNKWERLEKKAARASR